ncbi:MULTISPECIES: hypothetical protein [Ectopseudomonas]|jgi:hypothetical protein|uniref:Uncharacterized protein n=2 Tax=Ectopseudomonas TaxID=3236654 RepID=A0A1G6PW56_9GAMM|nr:MULTISPECIES: hypothetical protein [Pseudomonas]ALN21871.1 hypothetical protein DW68_024650 [Pseudomonas mendocina S5.2]KER98074.1 hypothetical protein HN51_25060 [Pseudomonas mendocina]MBP3061957.1 hypothetical protein [Pseudomonas chengduensis]NNB75250.1 hypothetical protein [Pseudomonas chengduensis]SDC84440.1 hypothetical protein SAMN05216576_107127 [Pseudomonas chengduensis]
MQHLTVTDMFGNVLPVTDLEKAIAEESLGAAMQENYHTEPFAYVDGLKRPIAEQAGQRALMRDYHQDVLDKLLVLKLQQQHQLGFIAGCWGHTFDAAQGMQSIRLVACNAGKRLIAAEMLVGNSWRSLTTCELKALADTLSAGKVLLDPLAHGLTVTATLPAWAQAQAVSKVA